ncbi:hypothetical protein NDU88_007345 [Pleurodeles waltl]|uniref:Uncharacterized protein n=1 Tax=Pleurodeles waltl TaxID=8319 RepID=A0AAV7MFV6_PLEWA|nr:hypothetical protein NDU88_007345 [Pleurodeles waltl]
MERTERGPLGINEAPQRELRLWGFLKADGTGGLGRMPAAQGCPSSGGTEGRVTRSREMPRECLHNKRPRVRRRRDRVVRHRGREWARNRWNCGCCILEKKYNANTYRHQLELRLQLL